MTKQAAKVSVLNELHEAIALYMLRRIKSSEPDPNAPKEYDEETGEELEPFFIPLAASELQVMVTFLNNNKITATVDAVEMKALADEFNQDLEIARRNRAEAITKVQANDSLLNDLLMN